ncbi:cupin domain-containing protein [Desulfobacterota bacterium AH_259_B03_O07]|nr:cupin domain-containing protein [Desulfobacterota bacterium AH_259_B03_O07]
MLTAEKLIEILNLRPHPMEGGYYAEIYRSEDIMPKAFLPERYNEDKTFGTSIYYLLTEHTKSLIHRLPTDEIYHFYLGDPVKMVQLYPDGVGKRIILGNDIVAGQHVQMLVPRGVWQGSHVVDGGSFALMGTTMAPGFDFSDFEGADKKYMIKRYPEYKDSILKLTP